MTLIPCGKSLTANCELACSSAAFEIAYPVHVREEFVIVDVVELIMMTLPRPAPFFAARARWGTNLPVTVYGAHAFVVKTRDHSDGGQEERPAAVSSMDDRCETCGSSVKAPACVVDLE